MKSKSLTLNKNSQGLRVFCSKCPKLYNFDTIHLCPHDSESQTYKSFIYLSNGTQKTTYKTKNYTEALALAIEFKKNVQNGIKQFYIKEPDELTVLDAANKFLNFKHGINVPIHMQETYSTEYLKSIEFYVGQFLKIMKDSGFNVKTINIKQLNEEHVGAWVIKIRSQYSKGTWNGPLRIMRLWIDYVIKRHKIDMYNPFLDVKLVSHENTVRAITKTEFENVCNAVETMDPIRPLNGTTNKHKNLYRPYLVPGFKLALYTGLRREELATLQWQNIFQIENTNDYMIITDNLKVERLTGKKYKRKYIPVGEELTKILHELGWKEKIGEPTFIIDPNRTVKIKTIMSALTKGFSHYYQQCYPEITPKQFNILRKTYLTYMGSELGQDVVKFSSHNGMQVLWNHYFDERILARAKNVRIFE